jgi:hypothetical protein
VGETAREGRSGLRQREAQPGCYTKKMAPEREAATDLEFEDKEGFLETRFLGIFTVDRFNRKVDAVVQECRQRKHSRVLIDVTRLQGKLSTVDRFEIGAHGARVASHLRIAVYGPQGLVDPGKFAARVGQNRGLSADTFTDRQAAVDWLLASPKATP